MYWVASGTIAANHRELEGAVRALDETLRANEGQTLRVGFTADVLGIDRDLLLRLLQLYEAQGVVKREVGYICPKCDGPLERTPGEGDLWCDDCEMSYGYRGRDSIGEKVWHVLPQAPKTGWQPSAEGAIAQPSAVAPVVIQFVGGDRGGGPMPQAMIPREQKRIEESVALGSRGKSFSFAAPIYSASIDELIGCHRAKPNIIHFAGHGDDRRLILVRDRDVLAELVQLSSEEVGTVFRNFPTRVRLVVFNTCYSLEVARHLTETRIVDLAIGVKGLIADDQAIQFAGTFYRQLAEGLSVQAAFEMARVHFGTARAAARPTLLRAVDVDTAQVVFA
jgi:hypothetical protein